MRITAKLLIGIAVLSIIAAMATAQTDKFGKVDTVYADVAKVNDKLWTVTISYTNDEAVVALSVPLKMTAGLNRIIADSAVYAGGRVEKWDYKAFRCDTAIQCVTLGMIANIGPRKNRLLTGSGRIATIFISSAEDKPIEKLTVDTTTTHPSNTLMAVADSIQETAKDTTHVERDKREILPAFVVRQSK